MCFFLYFLFYFSFDESWVEAFYSRHSMLCVFFFSFLKINTTKTHEKSFRTSENCDCVDGEWIGVVDESRRPSFLKSSVEEERREKVTIFISRPQCADETPYGIIIDRRHLNAHVGQPNNLILFHWFWLLFADVLHNITSFKRFFCGSFGFCALARTTFHISMMIISPWID